MLIAATTTATSTATNAAGRGSYIFPILLLGLALAWLIFIRPQRRKQKLAQSKLAEIAIGDEVITAGGLYGTVTRIDEDEVGVEIAPNVEVRLARRAIAAQLTEPEPESADTDGPVSDAPDSAEDAPG